MNVVLFDLWRVNNSVGGSEKVFFDMGNNLAKIGHRVTLIVFEGFSLALSEAMSRALPSVGCKHCPSVNTLIEDGVNGFLCDDTAEDIAHHLSLLMRSASLREAFGLAAQQKMRQFSPENVWQQWDLLLHEVTGLPTNPL